MHQAGAAVIGVRLHLLDKRKGWSGVESRRVSLRSACSGLVMPAREIKLPTDSLM